MADRVLTGTTAERLLAQRSAARSPDGSEFIAVQRQLLRERALASVDGPLALSHRRIELATGRAKVGIASLADLAVDSVPVLAGAPDVESTAGRRDLGSAKAFRRPLH